MNLNASRFGTEPTAPIRRIGRLERGVRANHHGATKARWWGRARSCSTIGKQCSRWRDKANLTMIHDAQPGQSHVEIAPDVKMNISVQNNSLLSAAVAGQGFLSPWPGHSPDERI
jgi:hypothetical protein